MFVLPRSSWLLVVFLVGACLAYGAAAQLTVSPPVALPHAPQDAVKAADIVNFSGVLIIPPGQFQATVYTVPFGKRLIVTTYNTGDPLNFDLVEDDAGTVTEKLGAKWNTPSGSPQQRTWTFALPVGLKFEPGTHVAIRLRDGYGPFGTPIDENVLLVGALFDS